MTIKSFKTWLETKVSTEDLSDIKRHHPEHNKEHWGFHLMLDMSGTNNKIKSATKIKDFINQVINTTKMKAVGKTIIKNFGIGDTAGYSALQLISTSSITFHAVNKYNDIYLDVFSCKDFNKEDVIKLAKEYFEPKYTKSKFIYRNGKRER